MPAIIGSSRLYEIKTGALLALADRTLPTALRTAAVIDSTGWAVEDQIMMDLLLQHAEQ